MTTQFDSFDQSPLGAFVESPLGARNGTAVLPASYGVFCFIDNADPYVQGGDPDAVFTADLAIFNTFQATNPQLKLSVVMRVPSAGAGLGPIERLPPTYVVNYMGSREVSQSEILGVYNSRLLPLHITKLGIGIDNSGSMTTVNVDPGLAEFEAVVNAAGIVTDRFEFDGSMVINERYLRWPSFIVQSF